MKKRNLTDVQPLTQSLNPFGIEEGSRDLNPGAFADLIREKKGKTPSDGDCKHDGEIHSYCAKCRKRMG